MARSGGLLSPSGPSSRAPTFFPLAGSLQVEPEEVLIRPSALLRLRKTFLINSELNTSEEVLRNGALGRIRTSDRLVRSQVLYPAELRARIRN